MPSSGATGYARGVRACSLIAIAVVGALGCQTETTPRSAPPPDDPIDAEVGPPFELTINPRLTSQPPIERSLTLRARNLDVGTEIVQVLPPVMAWPQVVSIDSLGRGRWHIQIFVDRAADQIFDDCPFPPSPVDPERLDTVDAFAGSAVLRVVPGGRGEIMVEQRICGPGDVETGLTGNIAALNGAVVEGPIRLMITPRAAADDVGPPAAPLRVTLNHNALDGPLPFSIGELAPGAYTLVAFADADGDATPTPCLDGAVGGGDRFVSPPRNMTVVAGQRVTLTDPLILSPAACPDALTGLIGRVALTPDLPADPDFDGPLGPLSGPLRLAWYPSINAEAVAQATVLEAIDDRPLPHTFTVSGVPPGVWRMVAWIDRDRDGSFTPCGGLSGIDATWVQVEDVVVADGELRMIEPLVLARNPCDDAAQTGLTGTLAVDVEPGAVGSGRPLRAELIPLQDLAPRSLQLAENHTQLPAERRFIANGIPAGRYDVIVYLDTNRDGRLTSCRDDAYADRAVARRESVTVEAGRITDLGEVRVQSEGCEVPRAELRPQFDFSERIPAGTVGDLRIEIEERGGFRTERRLRRRIDPQIGTLFTESIDLAPGEYRLTAWLDTEANGAFDDCEAEHADQVVARLDLTLDEDAPVRSPIFTMDLACGQ